MTSLQKLDREVCELLRELIRCESVNPPGNEIEVVEALERYLDRPNIQTRRSDVLPGRPNLYARVGSGSPTVMLNGHMDTVPVGTAWSRRPFEGELMDDRIFGRGAVDMKGGLAACAAVLARVAARSEPIEGSVILAAVIDEERGATGAKHLVDRDRLRADAVIVAEPTQMRLVTSTNGQLNFSARLHGRTAHSSEPDRGYDALRDARRLADALETHEPPYLVGMLNSGIAPNVVPDECRMAIDRRLGVDEDITDVEAEFAALLARFTRGAPRAAEFDVPLAVPPVSLAADHLISRTIAKSLAEAPPFLHSKQTMDASWFAAAGMPTVVVGPGDPGQAHQPDEHILVEDLVEGAELLERVVLDLLAALAMSDASRPPVPPPEDRLRPEADDR